MSQLTATAIKNLKADEKDYRIHDGNGLYLLVRKTGKKTFLHRQRKPKDTFTKIGNYPSVTLADARAYVANLTRKKEQEDSSIAHIDATFYEIAERLYKNHYKNLSATYAKQVRNMLDDDIYPHLKNKNVAKITSKDVYLIMKEISERGAITPANIAKNIMHTVFKYAISNLHCDNDPTLAVDTIKRKKVKHAVALNHHQLQRLFDEYESSTTKITTKLANRFLALTMLRTVEMCETKWTDIDYSNKLLTISADRMKRDNPHIVPLSKAALLVLDEIKEHTSDSEYIFASVSDKNRTMNRRIIYNSLVVPRQWLVDLKFGPHGFRATASTMLNQKGYRSDVIEKQLAHSSSNKVRASYNHADYLDERREMMEFWGNYVDHIIVNAIQKTYYPPIRRCTIIN
jgi:integrase